MQKRHRPIIFVKRCPFCCSFQSHLVWKNRRKTVYPPTHQGYATCYETVRRTVSAKFVLAKFGAACRWSESIYRMKDTEHTYTCAEKALYRSAPRLCNLLRNSPPDCFCQICLSQIWSSLSLVRVHKIAKEKPIRISVSAFFGSPSWTRTNDPAVNSRMLYQLSY